MNILICRSCKRKHYRACNHHKKKLFFIIHINFHSRIIKTACLWSFDDCEICHPTFVDLLLTDCLSVSLTLSSQTTSKMKGDRSDSFQILIDHFYVDLKHYRRSVEGFPFSRSDRQPHFAQSWDFLQISFRKNSLKYVRCTKLGGLLALFANLEKKF